ncbi:hypothetical protein BU24DRAFT_492303 [Aaosphaeria arxii CBS 175.79]|uniref:Uncharacterized protein n=1 Tax=Aaosphaeria arxii CBS 175.79 TaxID=1450172 RepID=A0A6A5XS77_9PLEO|nr:uncharacterized protein BU24DRAFT_492303 [Aaosphaeria arxii CBS 175.79]KAF2016158.1 hypothetical protein BU24DRAFT_492303 [Aaosphaeria arxii CBS 175.79]
MTSGSNTGAGLGEAIKKGVGLVHGSGEAIRGNFNAAVDSATGDRESAARHQAIASHGADEIDHGYHHQQGTGIGLTPVDQDHNKRAVGGPTTATSTNYGPHDSNIGNKVDPRVDSHGPGRYA